MVRKLFAVLLVVLFSLAGTLPVFAESDGASAGAVYVMTNAPSGNQVIVYNRAEDGTLSYAKTYDTGGLGSGVGVTVPPDPLGSQNSLLLSPDGHWLFAVNAGSNDISVFKVHSDGLERTARVRSGGSYPVSLTLRGGLLYALNAAGEGSISGFLLSGDGRLVPLKGSTRSLHAATPADGAQPQILESPAQIGFTPDGHFLLVTDKGGVSGQGRILAFRMIDGLLPSYQPVVTATQSPVPFAFTFDRYGRAVVLDASASTVTTYAISGSGHLSALGSVATGQAATCWIVSSGRYLFTDNTGASTISALRTGANGSVSLINAVAANTGAGSLPLDAGITHSGRYLYSLETGAGRVGAFRVNDDGSLTSLGTANGLPQVGGAQGIAVR